MISPINHPPIVVYRKIPKMHTPSRITQLVKGVYEKFLRLIHCQKTQAAKQLPELSPFRRFWARPTTSQMRKLVDVLQGQTPIKDPQGEVLQFFLSNSEKISYEIDHGININQYVGKYLKLEYRVHNALLKVKDLKKCEKGYQLQKVLIKLDAIRKLYDASSQQINAADFSDNQDRIARLVLALIDRDSEYSKSLLNALNTVDTVPFTDWSKEFLKNDYLFFQACYGSYPKISEDLPKYTQDLLSRLKKSRFFADIHIEDIAKSCTKYDPKFPPGIKLSENIAYLVQYSRFDELKTQMPTYRQSSYKLTSIKNLIDQAELFTKVFGWMSSLLPLILSDQHKKLDEIEQSFSLLQHKRYTDWTAEEWKAVAKIEPYLNDICAFNEKMSQKVCAHFNPQFQKYLDRLAKIKEQHPDLIKLFSFTLTSERLCDGNLKIFQSLNDSLYGFFKQFFNLDINEDEELCLNFLIEKKSKLIDWIFSEYQRGQLNPIADLFDKLQIQLDKGPDIDEKSKLTFEEINVIRELSKRYELTRSHPLLTPSQRKTLDHWTTKFFHFPQEKTIRVEFFRNKASDLQMFLEETLENSSFFKKIAVRVFIITIKIFNSLYRYSHINFSLIEQFKDKKYGFFSAGCGNHGPYLHRIKHFRAPTSNQFSLHPEILLPNNLEIDREAFKDAFYSHLISSLFNRKDYKYKSWSLKQKALNILQGRKWKQVDPETLFDPQTANKNLFCSEYVALMVIKAAMKTFDEFKLTVDSLEPFGFDPCENLEAMHITKLKNKWEKIGLIQPTAPLSHLVRQDQFINFP